jgi:hypothetical protein
MSSMRTSAAFAPSAPLFREGVGDGVGVGVGLALAVRALTARIPAMMMEMRLYNMRSLSRGKGGAVQKPLRCAKAGRHGFVPRGSRRLLVQAMT